VEVELQVYPKTNGFFFVAVEHIFSPSQRADRLWNSPSCVLRATALTLA